MIFHWRLYFWHFIFDEIYIIIWLYYIILAKSSISVYYILFYSRDYIFWSAIFDYIYYFWPIIYFGPRFFAKLFDFWPKIYILYLVFGRLYIFDFDRLLYIYIILIYLSERFWLIFWHFLVSRLYYLPKINQNSRVLYIFLAIIQKIWLIYYIYYMIIFWIIFCDFAFSATDYIILGLLFDFDYIIGLIILYLERLYYITAIFTWMPKFDLYYIFIWHFGIHFDYFGIYYILYLAKNYIIYYISAIFWPNIIYYILLYIIYLVTCLSEYIILESFIWSWLGFHIILYFASVYIILIGQNSIIHDFDYYFLAWLLLYILDFAIFLRKLYKLGQIPYIITFTIILAQNSSILYYFFLCFVWAIITLFGILFDFDLIPIIIIREYILILAFTCAFIYIIIRNPYLSHIIIIFLIIIYYKLHWLYIILPIPDFIYAILLWLYLELPWLYIYLSAYIIYYIYLWLLGWLIIIIVTITPIIIILYPLLIILSE